jgi:hypothetical protein
MTESNGVLSAGVLTPLRRNRFFYGKLMDTRHWELEQEYGIQSRRLINRLGLGAGVLCGLGVRLGEDGAVCIEPGVAVDSCGREIVVNETVALPRVDQPTDDCARPVGEPVRDGDVTIWLCYHECGSEYTRVANGDCGHRDQCVPGLLDERFALRIGTDRPERAPGLTREQCGSIFPPDPAGPPQREVIAGMLAGPCGHPSGCCVALATVRVNADGVATGVGVGVRSPLYSNEELFDLLLCLASRVEQCCGLRPTQHAPRVMAAWPPLVGEIDEVELQAFREERRLEIVFEREMRELALDKPDDWLGMWQVGADGAARLPLGRTGGALGHVTPLPGQDAVAYAVRMDADRNPEDVVYVVMMRSATGGAIAAHDDGAALDAEFAGTGLTDAERQKLWNLEPDGSLQPVAVRDHVLLPASPSLPSGDGIEGGEFHGAAARKTGVEVAPPPQLLRVWPAGGAALHPLRDDASESARRFLDHPRLQFVVSRAITEASLQEIGTWMRAFKTNRDEAIFGFDEIKASLGDIATSDADGPVTVSVDLDPAAFERDSAEVLVVMRPGAAPAGAEPVGVADPHDLLDADFSGTSLDKQTVITIFDGGPTDPIDGLDPLPTDGASLFDGTAGGLLHYSFTVFGLQG